MILGTKLVDAPNKNQYINRQPHNPHGWAFFKPSFRVASSGANFRPALQCIAGSAANYKNNTGPWGEAPRMTISPKLGEGYKRPGLCIKVPSLEKKTFSQLKMDGWKTTFLLGRPIFRGGAASFWGM